MVVLDSRINRAIKDKDVSEKLEHYENSQYAAVRIEFMKEYESLRDWDIEAVRERAEKEIKKILQGQGSMRQEIERGTEQKIKEARDKYRELENNFFDLQMENIKIKSELEKLRGENK